MRAVTLCATLCLALSLFALAGCDSGDSVGDGASSTAPDQGPVIGGGVDEPLIGGGVDESGIEDTDPTGDEDTNADPGDAPALSYPEGPYGKSNLEIIQDLAFFDPWEVKWRTFSDLHNNPAVKMVIISSSAGWCPACKTEAEHLVEYYEEFQADGLEVYFTMFEDNAGNDMVVDNEVTVAGMEVMNSWKALYGINYPFLIDAQKSLRDYQIDGGVPLTMIITTDDMMIRYIDEGYSSAFIENKILLYLYNH